jgi:2-C-methyl-D-erythritol 4-phosphate cytidylyltransferase
VTTRDGSTAPQDVTAIILAAGSSTRMGGADKIWADLDGVPVIMHSIRMCLTVPGIARLVLVAPGSHHAELRALVEETAIPVSCVEGGARRQDSVHCGIVAALEAAWYLVHDGARPLATPALACRVLEAARQHGAAVPGVPAVDTLKRIDADGRVIESPDRAALRAAQTPQAFAGDLLRRAHASIGDDVTDDAAMIERLGEPVQVVEGDPENLKITTALDLEIARLLLARRREGVE